MPVFSGTLFILLLYNPIAVWSVSFWLSFSAVWMIIYGLTGRVKPRGLWWKWGRTQWVVGIGLAPVSLLFFQQT